MYPKPFVKSSAELKERLHEEERALKDEASFFFYFFYFLI
jgi:hypothetical protein